MIQPWEFGGIPGDWIPPMRDVVDEVWVPSTWLRACYVESGVPAEKVFVVPNGVDTDFYTPDGLTFPLGTQKAFKFLFVGGTIRRKGIDTLIDVYSSTFTGQDDVCLVIKGFGSDTVYASNSIHQAASGGASRLPAPMPETAMPEASTRRRSNQGCTAPTEGT